MINYLSDPFSSYRQSSLLGIPRTQRSSMLTPDTTDQSNDRIFRPSPFGQSTASPGDEQPPPVIKSPFVKKPLFGPSAQAPDTMGGDTSGDVQDSTSVGVNSLLPQPPRRKFGGPIAPDPESPAEDKYKAFHDTMPQRGDYAPGALTRIGAALSGAAAGWKDPSSGYKTAQDIVNTPYKQAMEDYANKGAGLKEAADIEGKSQDDAVKRMQWSREQGLKYDTLDQTAWEKAMGFSQEAQKIGISQDQLAINAARAKAYISAQTRGDYDTKETTDGGLILINKHDSSDVKHYSAQQLGAITIAAGQLGVNQYNAGSQRIGANASATQANTGANRLGFDEAGGYQKSPTALDQTHGSDLAMEYLSRDKDFSKFIHIDPTTKRYTVKPEAEQMPGYDAFIKALNSSSRAATDGVLFGPRQVQAPQPFQFSLTGGIK